MRFAHAGVSDGATLPHPPARSRRDAANAKARYLCWHSAERIDAVTGEGTAMLLLEPRRFPPPRNR
jgi:hypothetical protein